MHFLTSNSGYEEEILGNNVRKIHYLCGGNGLAAVYVSNAGKDTLYYAHTDYQGSLTALSLPNGTVVERYAYDPWGKRRNPGNWTQADTRTAFILNRGYTMHEHLPEFNLINMNGRVYDPLTAMFFSPDPYLQAPGNWLNYNRYGYCLNNPFLYTDPDGEWIHIVIGAVIGGVVNWVAHGAEFSWNGLAAFGVGVTGGALMAATGGAVAGVFGAGVGAGGAIGGTLAAGTGYTYGTMATSIGNNAFFGDPMPTAKQFFTGLGMTMFTGGLFNGAMAMANGRNFWTGNLNVPKPILPDLRLSNLPKRELNQPDLGKTAEQIKTPLQSTEPNNNSFSVMTQERTQIPSVESNAINIQRPQINGYTPRLAGQLDLYHNFPTAFDEIIVQNGGIAQRISDGTFMFTAPGTINGVNGVYTIGVNQQNIIYHRCFYEWSNFLRNF